MRTFFIVLFIVICSGSYCCAAPQIVVNVTHLDWGQIYSGDVKEGDFIISNVGDEPLIVNRVRSSCGCTAAMLKVREIPPGGEAQLHVRFNSKHFRGRVEKRIMVQSNDPLHRQTVLTTRATIIVELAASPGRFSCGTLAASAEISKELTLKNSSDIPLEIKSVRLTSPYMRVINMPQQLQPGEAVVATLVVTVPEQYGTVLNGYILIDAQGHSRNQLRIPVVARVRPQGAEKAN